MHAEAFTWLAAQAEDLRDDVDTAIDLGGRDINGSPRELFPGAGYTAIDLHDGPGVDVVADARQWQPEEKVDLVVCAEVLEHTDDPRGLLDVAAGWLKQAGVLLLTAAAEPRAPHSHLDGGPVRPGEHYANIDPGELASWLEDGPWYPPQIVHDGVHGDVYCRVQRR